MHHKCHRKCRHIFTLKKGLLSIAYNVELYQAIQWLLKSGKGSRAVDKYIMQFYIFVD